MKSVYWFGINCAFDFYCFVCVAFLSKNCELIRVENLMLNHYTWALS